jgi:hypothetical protein
MPNSEYKNMDEHNISVNFESYKKGIINKRIPHHTT